MSDLADYTAYGEQELLALNIAIIGWLAVKFPDDSVADHIGQIANTIVDSWANSGSDD
jgi:hypothetical protein